MAILVAVVSAMAFLNGMVSFFGNLIGHPEVTFEWILGKIFIPLAWMMGVEWADCEEVGRLLGKKLILNEYIAYGDLGQLDREGAISKVGHASRNLLPLISFLFVFSALWPLPPMPCVATPTRLRWVSLWLF